MYYLFFCYNLFKEEEEEVEKRVGIEARNDETL
jgi:hypothetical protein